LKKLFSIICFTVTGKSHLFGYDEILPQKGRAFREIGQLLIDNLTAKLPLGAFSNDIESRAMYFQKEKKNGTRFGDVSCICICSLRADSFIMH
jgi:hypothetical protein